MNSYLPVIGITMGDAAGVGAEVIVKSLAHAPVYEQYRPLVIGDARRLERANEIVGDNMAVYAGTKGLNDSAKGHCPSPDDIDTPELTRKILGWLHEHPELNDQDTETSVWAAGDSLWPCH